MQRLSIFRRDAPASSTVFPSPTSTYAPAPRRRFFSWRRGALEGARLERPRHLRLFGDGCGAVLLSAETGDRGILASAIHSDGSMADFITMPGGGSKIPASHKSVDDNLHVVKMMGNETFKVAVRRIEGACREALEKADIPPEQVKWFIPHQANTRIISAVAERLGWPSEKYVINIDRIGNTSAGSIPIALDEIVREGKVSDNDILIFSAFGAGVTWGASVIRW